MGSRVQLFSRAQRGRKSKGARDREGCLSTRPLRARRAVAIRTNDAPSRCYTVSDYRLVAANAILRNEAKIIGSSASSFIVLPLSPRL
jgi:hypothetical protein